MNDLNKLAHTKVGDNIDYYINGVPEKGTVVKMNNSFVSVLKADGTVSDIHVNDTFFVKDIIKESKTWNGMTGEERTEALIEAHAFSPRFLSKTWEDLPKELQDVLTKTNIEESTHGQLGGNRAGISTDTDIKTPDDYKGQTDDRDKQTKEEFKHDNDKPTVDKNNGMEKDHKKKDQFDGMKEDWRNTGGDSDKHKIKSTWLEKDIVGTKGKPKDPPKLTGFDRRFTEGMNYDEYEPADEEDAKLAQGHQNKQVDLLRQGKLRGVEDKKNRGWDLIKTEPLWKTWLSKTLNRPSGFAEEGARTRKEGVEEGERPTQDNPFPKTKIPKGHKAPTAVGKPKHGGHGYNTGNASRFNTSISDASKRGLKKYGQPHYGVTTLDKEGDGAGNSGVISTETTGVYNPRNVNSDGRYRDQERDRKDERDSRN